MNFFLEAKRFFALSCKQDEVLVIEGNVESERSERSSALWEKGKDITCVGIRRVDPGFANGRGEKKPTSCFVAYLCS